MTRNPLVMIGALIICSPILDACFPLGAVLVLAILYVWHSFFETNHD